MSISQGIEAGLKTGFIDCKLDSLEQYHPKLLVNDDKRSISVLSNIIRELNHCEEFYFSVAFITNSGVASLVNVLSELRDKQIKGKIIASQYQNFTQPKALERLLEFENIQLRIVTEGNFHAKGYIFKHTDSYSFIVGSTNLTQNALSVNKEWNIKLSSLENGMVMQNIMQEFDRTFQDATVVDHQWISLYNDLYLKIRQSERELKDRIESKGVINLNPIYPNEMQKKALHALSIKREEGKGKALLISATGTGKTYLSAFDVKLFRPKRFLFVVHRENIARAAMKSYKAILGQDLDVGLLSGGSKDYSKSFLFSTIQTLSKDHVLTQFSPEHFDYIVIDEVHRSGAGSYQKVINYFNPKFLLGMTATPERTDGFDIFTAFHNNIAYEIRLHQALEENMLCPFHYYGISEIEIDGTLLDDGANFNQLTCEERVRHIIDKARFYGWDQGRVKGLVFCSRREEARTLSDQFNLMGYDTVALDGQSSEDQREDAICRLEQDNPEGKLDYIFTVDIFNEGVDIPSVNQIIMLRPTQSAIVFVQQLGRGLRKANNKEYLTVIDFIGNYTNNYLVPIALYGDKSFNKDTIRKLIINGSSAIPGCSTVNFDKVTTERIFSSIDVTNLSKMKGLKEDYQHMKYLRGKVPSMVDFLEYGQREPYAFVEKEGSYYNFLQKVETEMPYLEQRASKLLEFYSREILTGKRVEDTVLLSLLLAKGQTSETELQAILKENFSFAASEKTLESVVNSLNGTFLTEKDQKKYGIYENISWSENLFYMAEEYRAYLLQDELNEFLNDMIRYGFKRFQSKFRPEIYRDGFLLYQKYSRKDASRILNWEKDESSTIYGYRIKNNTCPIFVTYKKDEDISDGTKYHDRFINPYSFGWQTKNRRTLQSKDVMQLQAWAETGMRILLFYQKSKDEGGDFYYAGDMTPISFDQSEIMDKGVMVPIVDIIFRMKDEVEESLYQYLES